MSSGNAPARALRATVRAGDIVVGVAANLACAALVCLAAGIILEVVLRWLGVDNSATYDLTLFSLSWVGFAGAVLTARLGFHVTSGISLEAYVGRGERVIVGLRFAVMFVALLLFAWSGWQSALSSFQTGEVTYDTPAWPVWVAKAALPTGFLFWALVELVGFLRTLLGQTASGFPADDGRPQGPQVSE